MFIHLNEGNKLRNKESTAKCKNARVNAKKDVRHAKPYIIKACDNLDSLDLWIFFRVWNRSIMYDD